MLTDILNSAITLLIRSVYAFAAPFIILGITIALYFINDYIKFKASGYKEASENRYISTRLSKGLYGEYLTFAILDKIHIDKRLLANAYISRNDGCTTEIDLIMVCPFGIYLFESKNFGGWIFGNERD